jgi:hypothetical protein
MNLQQLMARARANRGYSAPEGEHIKPGGPPNADNDDGKAPNADDKQGEKEDKAAELLIEVMKKKEKIQSLSTQNTDLETQLSALSETVKSFEGIDPELFKELVAERQTRKESDLEGKGDWKALKESLVESHESEKTQMSDQHKTLLTQAMEGKDSELATLRETSAKSDSIIEELTIGNSFNTSKYVSDNLIPSSRKVRILYGPHFDVVSGEVQAFDNPRGAEKRNLLVDEKGKPLSFELALTKIIDQDIDKDTILRAPENSGGNSGSENRGGDSETKVGMGVNRIAAGLAGKS